MMTIQQLYDKLRSPAPQPPETQIFYNIYVYQYPAPQEYEIRRQVDAFKQNLKLPEPRMDVLKINIFEEFCNYLNSKIFGFKRQNMLEYLTDKGNKNAAAVTDILQEEACGEDFLKSIHKKIKEHVEEPSELNKCYVFLYGFGQMFPYLRTNSFLTNYEKYNEVDKYKLIVFYPGHQVGNAFSLFDCLDDAHTYRAIMLVNDN